MFASLRGFGALGLGSEITLRVHVLKQYIFYHESNAYIGLLRA